jgi:hypothetical protein
MTTSDDSGTSGTPASGAEEDRTGGVVGQAEELEEAQTVAADVTSPGEPLSRGENAPSSGPYDGPGPGTASGTPLAGTGAPSSEPVYPDGADVPAAAESPSEEDADPTEPGGRG